MGKGLVDIKANERTTAANEWLGVHAILTIALYQKCQK